MPTGKKTKAQKARKAAAKRNGRNPSKNGRAFQIEGSQNSPYPVISPNHRVLGGFPSEVRVTLKYVERVSLNPASNSVASNQFALNGMYDPNTTGTGHQPSNFDRWMTIYNAYTVNRTHVKVTQAWNSTSSVAPSFMGFLVSASGSQVSGFSSPETLMEQPYCKYADYGTGQPNTAPFTGALTATVPMAPWFGVRPEELRIAAYSGSAAANPATGVALEVFLWSFGTSSGTAVDVKVELEFEAVFFSPKITLPSLVSALVEKNEEKKDDGLLAVCKSGHELPHGAKFCPECGAKA